MSVVDPFSVPGGQIRDDSWPFSSVVISTDTTEPSTEPSPLPELCVCPLPREVTRLDVIVEAVTAINCKALSIPTEMQSTVLTVTIQGNNCNSFGEVALSVGSGGIPEGTGGGVPPDDCPGITGPAVLDFGDFERFDDGVDVRSSSQVLYDPADYPGQTSARFRATVVKATGVYGTDPAISIVDENGTLYLTPTLSFTLAPTGFLEAYVDEAITLDPNAAHTYYLRTTVVAGGFQTFVPRLWIFMTASDQAKFQIPVMTGVAADNESFFNTTSTSYTRPGSSSSPSAIFKKDTGGFSEIDYWQLNVVADPRTGTGNLALFNVTTNQQVTGAAVTIAVGAGGTTNAVYSVQFSDTATNFTDGDEFEFRIKYNSVAGPTGQARVILVTGHVYVKIGSGTTGYFTAPNLCAESAMVYVRTGVMDCETIYLDRGYHYLAADWPAVAPQHYEATEFGVFTLYLKDTGTYAVPIDPPTNIASLSFPGGSWTRQRTSVTLTNDHIYTVGNLANPFFDEIPFIISFISGP